MFFFFFPQADLLSPCWWTKQLSMSFCRELFLFGDVLVLNAVGRRGVWKKTDLKENTYPYHSRVRYPEDSFLQLCITSSSSIFLLSSSFSGWSGCQAISNLFFQYYQIKIAGTPLNSCWCLLLEFVSLSCLLCFPGGRVSQPRSAGDSAWAWWHLDCPSGHYRESWSIFLKCFSIWERDVQGQVEH